MRKTPAIKLYWKSFAFLGPARKKWLLGTLLGSCELALLFAAPYVNRALLDIVTGERQGNIMVTLLQMLGLFLLLVPPVIWGKFLTTTASREGSVRLYKRMFHHVTHMPYSVLTKYRTGDYLTRLRDDADRTCDAFRHYSMLHLVRFAVVFPVTLGLLLVNDWHIALAGALYGCVNLALSLYLNPLAKRIEAQAKGEIVHSASLLLETLQSMPVVRVFVLHRVLAERYRRVCEAIREKRMKYQNIIGLTYGVVDFFAQSAQAVGFIIGILLAKNDQTLGQAAFNATLMGMLGDAIYRLSTFLLLCQPNLVSMERVYGLLAEPLEDLESGGKEVDVTTGSAVEFRDVSFSYDGKTNAVDHLTFTLRRGEHLAIAGGSGGGKSTVIKLIEGFYAPTGGQISYFGKTGLSLRTLRGLFAYVPQECTLFDGSVRENIAMGRPQASQEEIEHAARMADIHDFILSLPQGYDTPVGERGSQLSGGQRQRVAIARSILKNAPVLLLDEATASLDSSAEQEVQRCIDRIAGTMTTVTVAHRLSTIQNADRILVIEGGKIVEEGKFQELLDRGGRFRELYEDQEREERQKAQEARQREFFRRPPAARGLS